MNLVPASLFGAGGGGTYIDPIERLKQLGQEYQLHPGRAPMGSGSTGLNSNDREGWSKMLEEQQQFLKLNDFMDRGKGIDVQYGGDLGSTRTISPATGMNNQQAFMSRGLPARFGGSEIQRALGGLKGAVPNQPAQLNQPNYESHDQFKNRYGR